MTSLPPASPTACALVDAAASTSIDRPQRLPWAGLLTLAGAGFVTILTEALPAGVLPQMSATLGVSQGMVGQLVTAYALGSLLAAIPIVALTRHWPRRPLLLLAIAGFAVTNAVTALSTHYSLTLIAPGFAGVSAGALWALLAGYASALVPPRQQGRAIAVAMVGTPLALSLGIPAGTLLGQTIGWRWTFLLMTVFSVLLMLAARFVLPAVAGGRAGSGLGLREVIRAAGILRVLSVLLLFVLAHNILYTYIAPLLERRGESQSLGAYLLLFGVSALGGIWLTGLLIDRWMRPLVILSIAAFLLAAVLLGGVATVPLAVPMILWGLGFGGAPTLFQTHIAQLAAPSADIAQSLVVTCWNAAIAGGGVIGGVLLERAGAGAVAWSAVPLLVLSALLVVPRRVFR